MSEDAKGVDHAAARGRSSYARDTQTRGGGADGLSDDLPVSTEPVLSQIKGWDERHLPSGGRAHFFISQEWTVMASAMLASGLMLAFSIPSPPPPSSVISWALAIACAASCGFFVRIERSRMRFPGRRILALVSGVGLPMLLFGGAIADWTAHDPLVPWISAVGVLAITGLLAAVLLTGRMLSISVATIALWTPIVTLSGTDLSYAVLLAGMAGSGLAIVRNMRVQQDMQAKRSLRERVQARALEILIDFEASGLGWFWETDRNGVITYVSPSVGEIVDEPVEALVGRSFFDLFRFDVADQDTERAIHYHFATRSFFKDLTVKAAAKEDGRWWSISGRPIHDDLDNFLGFRGFGNDLTERRRTEERASRLAQFDSLTGLANRFCMSQILEKTLQVRQDSAGPCAVFLLDLDRFKQVNDTLGHPAGDALLKQVAQRLENAVEKPGRVGRLGGDEFQVILPGHFDRDDLARHARTIIDSLSEPYMLDSDRVVIGASLGIAVSPEDGRSAEALIRNADLALYAAKDAGRGRYHFYAADLHSDAEERRQLEHDLRDAISEGGLELVYQPVIQTTSEKITGFEALLRWNHPALGPIEPAKFIPIAEDAGLIPQIGEWALRTACRDLSQWPDPIRVAVNVSALQFANTALPSIVTSALAAAQIAPSRLELEITESVFLADVEGIDATFSALKRMGVRLALDDFGTGYSALGYLKKAPFDKIKIDQSFVRGATIDGSRNGAIIASIVILAESLGMETTAEGVETLDELDLVRMLGCSHVQGFIYEKPLTAHEAGERLRSGLVAHALGPKSNGSVRRTLLRKVKVEYQGKTCKGTIRNISESGAMIEGLWDVAPGTIVDLRMADGERATATIRWARHDQVGVEFIEPFSRPLRIERQDPQGPAEEERGAA